jgi:NAD(P)-dependent dehydrogenase (short-subunit alcohol dehydrogenase family)
MDQFLDGKVAVVTGAGHGIGRGHALELARRGARVVVNDIGAAVDGTGTGRDADLTVDLITSRGGIAVADYGDVGDEVAAEAMISRAVDEFGRLDIVVNNAGAAVMLDHHDLDGLTDDMWRRMLDLNLMSAWYLSRAAVPALSVAGGSIVNISSLAGVHPTGSGSSIAYAVAKAAVNHLTVLLANTLGPDGIRVNAIAVGPIETPMWGLEGDQIRGALRHRTLLGRPGTPAELAQACLMLAAPGYTTAQVLVVDGGMQFRVPR